MVTGKQSKDQLKKKSAILESIHRRSRTTQMNDRDSHRDYPIVYKYILRHLVQPKTWASPANAIYREKGELYEVIFHLSLFY